MKLNYKRTICVGFAFFLICAFWQAYDNSIPMLLIHKFHMSQTASGAIMALDNVLAFVRLNFRPVPEPMGKTHAVHCMRDSHCDRIFCPAAVRGSTAAVYGAAHDLAGVHGCFPVTGGGLDAGCHHETAPFQGQCGH